jgi:hypothetical protein
MVNNDPAMNDWIERARAADVWEVLNNCIGSGTRSSFAARLVWAHARPVAAMIAFRSTGARMFSSAGDRPWAVMPSAWWNI